MKLFKILRVLTVLPIVIDGLEKLVEVVKNAVKNAK